MVRIDIGLPELTFYLSTMGPSTPLKNGVHGQWNKGKLMSSLVERLLWSGIGVDVSVMSLAGTMRNNPPYRRLVSP